MAHDHHHDVNDHDHEEARGDGKPFPRIRGLARKVGQMVDHSGHDHGFGGSAVRAAERPEIIGRSTGSIRLVGSTREALTAGIHAALITSDLQVGDIHGRLQIGNALIFLVEPSPEHESALAKLPKPARFAPTGLRCLIDDIWYWLEDQWHFRPDDKLRTEAHWQRKFSLSGPPEHSLYPNQLLRITTSWELVPYNPARLHG